MKNNIKEIEVKIEKEEFGELKFTTEKYFRKEITKLSNGWF